MSAKPQDLEPIERPENLDLPPEAETVFAYLTEQGAAVFSREIIRALTEAQAKGNLRPVRDVIEAWYRTLVLRQEPGYQEALAWARRSRPKRGMAAEELIGQ